MIILGIDCGESTGLAWYENGKLIRLETVNPMNIPNFYGIDTVVIEDSRLQKHVWCGEHLPVAQRLKIARDIGRIDMQCGLISRLCSIHEIPIIMLSPKQKGAKVRKEMFEQITGWTKKSNPHTRDAAMVAWPYRNLRNEVKK
jgi:hypothetical protein